jgi:hypothetical protein
LQPEDRNLTPLAAGDVVSFVYGGEHHTMTVAHVARGMGAQWLLTGTITVSIPAASTTLAREKGREDQRKTDEQGDKAASADSTTEGRVPTRREGCPTRREGLPEGPRRTSTKGSR